MIKIVAERTGQRRLLRSGRTGRLVVVLALMASGAGFAAPPAAAKFAYPPPCLDILFVGARGSGQPIDGNESDTHTGMGEQVYLAYKRFWQKVDPRQVAAVAVIYPAQPVSTLTVDMGAYFRGLEDGVGWTKDLLAKRAASCPNERIVLSGYSQGAMVMHRVLQDLAADPSQTSAGILSRVDGAILIADGDRVRGENTTNYGSSGKGAGVGELFPTLSGSRHTRLPDSLLSRVHSICDRRDMVCDFSEPYHSAAAGAAHGGYIHTHHYKDSADLRNAAGAVAERLIRDRTTWTITPGAFGPLTVGMTGKQAVATRNVKPTPNSLCDTPYGFTGKPKPEWVYMEWRMGSRADLDELLVKSGEVRAPQGVGVGSSRLELEAAFGSRLLDARVYFELDPGDGPVLEPAVYDSGRVMLFLMTRNSVVETIHLGFASPGALIRLGGGC